MQKSSVFDVFLCYNSKDQARVKEIAEALKKRELNPWFDQEQLACADLVPSKIEKTIYDEIIGAAVIIGQSGVGTWQRMELDAILTKYRDKPMPVIPVLLPGVDKIPHELLFIRNFKAIKFTTSDDVAYNIEWAIIGEKGKEQRPLSNLKIQQNSNKVGKETWEWSVWLTGNQQQLDEVKNVLYILHPSYPEHRIMVDNRSNNFRLTAQGWGTFTLLALIVYRDGRQNLLKHKLVFQ